MISNLKAGVVVMGIAIIVFAVARPFCLRFMTETDFVRRRNIWFALTFTAFVSPNFWVFAAIALPILAWGAHRDPNPLALFILTYCVIPANLKFAIPMVGANLLFDMSYHHILSFAILIPVAQRLLKNKDQNSYGGLTAVELFVLAFAALILVRWMPYESITNTMRRGFLAFLNVILLYFVAIRACSTRKAIVEVMATFCLLCAVIAAVAAFESVRHWLLYQEIAIRWGRPTDLAYLQRDGSLRAQVTAGHSIPLGYLLAYGFVIWLYLSPRVKSLFWTVAYGALMWMGLLSAHARSAWIAAIAMYFTFLALTPNAARRVLQASFVLTIFAVLLLFSPWGERVINNLPFIGTVDQANVNYRWALAAMSWEMVKINPFFGDPFVMDKLESLRTGEGIIDLVNQYAEIAMFNGLVGLSLFLAPIVISLWKVYRLSRKTIHTDPDHSMLGAVLAASLCGYLLTMAFGGNGEVINVLLAVVIGLSATYARLDTRPEIHLAESSRLAQTGTQLTSRWR